MIDPESETQIAEAVEALLDVSLSRHYDPIADETFMECRVCHRWDTHTLDCFVPWLEQWQNTPASKSKRS